VEVEQARQVAAEVAELEFNFPQGQGLFMQVAEEVLVGMAADQALGVLEALPQLVQQQELLIEAAAVAALVTLVAAETADQVL
jgi:hypothetical protein